MNDKQVKEFELMTKEMMIWMDRNCHPHTKLILNSTSAEIVEGVACNTNDDLVD